MLGIVYVCVAGILYLDIINAQNDRIVTAHPWDNATIIWHLNPPRVRRSLRALEVGTYDGTFKTILYCNLYFDIDCTYHLNRTQLLLLPPEAMSNSSANVSDIGITLINTRVGDATTYILNSRHPFRRLRLRAVLYVYQTPSRPIISYDSERLVGRDVVLSCTSSSQSVPAQTRSQFVLRYTWDIAGIAARTSQRNNSLLIHNSTKADSGARISCWTSEVNSTLVSEVSRVFTLDLYYLDSLRFSDDQSEHVVFAGERVSTACTASCNPPCSYQWTDDRGSLVTTGNAFVIANVTDAVANKVYTCQAANAAGTMRKQLLISLVYKPEILDFRVTPRLVVEGNRTTMICNTRNNTDTSIALSTLGSQQLPTAARDNVAIFTWEQIDCSKTGQYECRAENDHGVDIRTVNLDVKCPPKMRLGNSTNQVFVVEQGSAFNFRVDLTANPVPGLADTTLGHLPAGLKQSDSTLNNMDMDIVGSTISLGIQSVTAEDYGTYSLYTRNEYGNMMVLFELNPPGPGINKSVVGLGVITALLLACGVILGTLWFIGTKRHKAGSNEEQQNTQEQPTYENTAFDGVELGADDLGGDTYDNLGPDREEPSTESSYQAISVPSGGKTRPAAPDVYEEVRVFPK